MNDLFQGELTDQDKLTYVTQVIAGKMLESGVLRQQAANNAKAHFASSPDLRSELDSAPIDAHSAMSRQALESERVKLGMLDILLNHAGLYERLRGAGVGD